MEMLEVSLIGRFAIEYDGKPVILSSRVAQSLFAYLILKAGVIHRREKLAGMFWRDAPEERARAYLRHELWRIRRALSPAVFLLSDDIGVAFDSSTEYWLDAKVLEHLTDAASANELKTALASHQGELLPGFYDDWIVSEREHLQTLFEQKMGRLVELLQKEKRWTEIIEWAERWILFGQAPEAAFRALMVAYEALEDRAKVASTYARCRQALQQLGLEPSQETQALAFNQASSLSIPVPLNSFVGRKKELQEVIGLLSKSRLVTLTGVGGVGKTRLSIQVVLETLGMYPDGTWLLDLTFLNEPAQVPTALAGLLGIGNAAYSKQSVLDFLRGYLRLRNALLIFDNCEHLIEACAQLANFLLQACPELRILATSREPLRIAGEVPYRVPSLEVPGSDMASAIDTLADVEAVRLFVERAAAVSRRFVISRQNAVTIGQICRRLDGIPLAIELAAARIGRLSLEQILARLDDRFDLLMHGPRTAPARHQTLRATIEWSYSLLSEPEGLLFRRLAVFVGGWTLEAAEEVCSGGGIEAADILDLLSQLVEKSLITTETSNQENRYPAEGWLRYRRFETIRQYAHEKFNQSGEAGIIRTRHLEYYLQFAEQAESALMGPSQSRWYARLTHERDNLRAALEWADQSDVEAGLFLSGRLYRFWELHDFHEGSYWLKKFLQKPESNDFPRARAKASCVYGQILVSLQQYEEALAAATESLKLYRAFGDQPGQIDGLLLLASILTDPAQKSRLNQEALGLAHSLGDISRKVSALWQVGSLYQGEKCFIYWEEAITLARPLGDWRWLAGSLSTLGFFLLKNGDAEAAQKYLDEAEALYREYEMKTPPAHLLSAYGEIALMRGDFEKARSYLEQIVKINAEYGRRQAYLWVRARLGYVALREGTLEEAGACFSEVARSFEEDKYEIGVVYALEGMASLFLSSAQPERAARLLGWADATRERISDMRPALEQADVERNIAATIEQIGKTEFEEAYNRGRDLSLEEAVKYALVQIKFF